MTIYNLRYFFQWLFRKNLNYHPIFISTTSFRNEKIYQKFTTCTSQLFTFQLELFFFLCRLWEYVLPEGCVYEHIHNFFCQCSLSTPPLKTVLKFNLFYILFKKMSGPKIEVVKGIVPVCGLGEAPHWCPKEQVLYFVDIFNSRLLRYNPSNGVCNYVTVSIYIFFWIMQSIT